MCFPVGNAVLSLFSLGLSEATDLFVECNNGGSSGHSGKVIQII